MNSNKRYYTECEDWGFYVDIDTRTYMEIAFRKKICQNEGHLSKSTKSFQNLKAIDDEYEYFRKNYKVDDEHLLDNETGNEDSDDNYSVHSIIAVFVISLISIYIVCIAC